MPSTTDTATTRDGLRIVTRHWAADAPRAAVLLVHGLAEHSGRYEHVGAQLATAGLETFGWDHRGFGGSAGERAWVDRWSRYHEDVEDRLAAVRAAVPGLPVAIYGHSMGGLIALGYALSGRPQPDLLILSAPGIDDEGAAWKHLLAPLLARLVPKVHFPNGIAPELVSRDPARHEADRRDPLLLSSSTAALGARFFEEQARLRAAVAGRPTLPVPTLVIHGLDDRLVPPSSSEALVGLGIVTRRAYAGIRHELHNEPEGPAILADVIAWVDAHVAGAPLPVPVAARAGDVGAGSGPGDAGGV